MGSPAGRRSTSAASAPSASAIRRRARAATHRRARQSRSRRAACPASSPARSCAIASTPRKRPPPPARNPLRLHARGRGGGLCRRRPPLLGILQLLRLQLLVGRADRPLLDQLDLLVR